MHSIVQYGFPVPTLIMKYDKFSKTENFSHMNLIVSISKICDY